MVLLAKGRDLAGGFAAYPSALKPSDPHWNPGPGRVDHLHHHAPVALCDHPTTRAASAAITGLYVEHQTVLTPSGSNQMEALQTDEQITREEGKPEKAIPKIVEGRLNGFYKDVVLLEQPSLEDNKKTVAQVTEEAGVKLTGFRRFEVGQA